MKTVWKALELPKLSKKKTCLAWVKIKKRFSETSLLLYLRIILIFMWNNALREKFNFYFSKAFCWYWRGFPFWGRGSWVLSAILWGFDIFLVFRNLLRSWVLRRWVTPEATQHVMFISNNCASFHVWWTENLLKHQKVSKYYENSCSLV